MLLFFRISGAGFLVHFFIMVHTGSYLSFENSPVFKYNLSHLILSTNIDWALNRRQALVWWYGAGDAVLNKTVKAAALEADF